MRDPSLAPLRLPASAYRLRIWTAVLIGMLALFAAGQLRAEGLVISLSNHQVLITSNYTGSQVTLFGAVQRDEQTIARTRGYDVAIVVRGPRAETMTVRRKEQLGPIWINRAQHVFEDVPRYVAILSSQPLEELASPVMRERLRLGLDAIVSGDESEAEADMEALADSEFRDALIRLRMRDGMFFEVGRGVTFITPMIFRAAIPLPAEAPPGNYEVETLLFADGILLARDITNFELVKTGFEQRVGVWAETHAAMYGLFTVLMALFFGWLASVIFRRD